jgi:hypothetical protein
MELLSTIAQEPNHRECSAFLPGGVGILAALILVFGVLSLSLSTPLLAGRQSLSDRVSTASSARTRLL